MDYNIVEMPAFKFAGISKRVPLQFEGINNAIVELTNSITQKMKEEGYLTHLIGVLTTTEEDVSELLDVIEVPAYTWAVFPNEGPFPEALQQTYVKIYSEWLYELKIHVATTYYWRHKMLNALRSQGFTTLTGIIESDETYFLESDKGKRNLAHRKPRKRGGSASKRGISKEQISVIVAYDRSGKIFSKMAGRGRITPMKSTKC